MLALRYARAQDDAAGTAQHDQPTIVTTLAGIDAAVMSQASVEQSVDVKVMARTLRAALACLRTPCGPPVHPLTAVPRSSD